MKTKFTLPALLLATLLQSAVASISYAHQTFIPEDNKSLYPCDIQVINQTNRKLEVNGIFDNGNRILPFVLYPSYSNTINLFYYGYCHAGMEIYVDTFEGYRVYGGYTAVNNVVRISQNLDGKFIKR